jgi:glutamine synthetase
MSKPSARSRVLGVVTSRLTLDGARNTFHDPREGGWGRRGTTGGQLKRARLTALYCPPSTATSEVLHLGADRDLGTREPHLRAWIIAPDPKASWERLARHDLRAWLLAASVSTVEPGEPVSGNAYRSDAAPLPRNLRDAITLLDRSTVARELLGEEFVDHYLRTRTWEVRQYERAVTTWELERYFELA